MLKKLSLAVAVASATLSGLAFAETVETPVGKLDVTMTATLATDWINRGRTLNDGATVQGSLDVAHESGLYVGIWGGSMPAGVGSEIDYYVGYGAAINDDVSFDLNLATYTYDKTGWDDDIELSASISAFNATFGAKYRFEATEQTYLHVGYDLALPADFGLSLNVGHTLFKAVDLDTGGSMDDYNFTDWGVTLSRTVVGVDAALSYTSTTLDEAECAYLEAFSCENNVTFSVSKTF